MTKASITLTIEHNQGTEAPSKSIVTFDTVTSQLLVSGCLYPSELKLVSEWISQLKSMTRAAVVGQA